jgi:hypothetical protein
VVLLAAHPWPRAPARPSMAMRADGGVEWLANRRSRATR